MAAEQEREREYRMPGGSLYYEKVQEAEGECEIRITRMQGLAGELEIPDRIEDHPVRVIGRKAFLSRKHLRRVTIPAGVREIGDWAFAYCDGLHTVILRTAGRDEETRGGGTRGIGTRGIGTRGETPRFGRAVFLECSNLRFLYVNDEEGTAALLAAAITVAEAPYLLDVCEAGGREWLEKWDARMLAVLHGADDEGYSKQVLCGEEDYGSTDPEAYESGRRRIKVRLLLLRLLYPAGLSPELRREMEAYLQAHTKGRAHEETWRVVLEEHGEESAYYRLFADIGCVSEENLEALLRDVGGEYPEMKAYLMRYKEERLGYGDFFGELDL